MDSGNVELGKAESRSSSREPEVGARETSVKDLGELLVQTQ